MSSVFSRWDNVHSLAQQGTVSPVAPACVPSLAQQGTVSPVAPACVHSLAQRGRDREGASRARIAPTLLTAFLFLLAFNTHAAEPLADEQLDVVTAGTAAESQELLEFHVKHETASGKRVAVDGTIDVERVRSIENASLLLQDSAQSNLQSLININAVQSAVNVLVNLNITIDSTVGEIRQLNLAVPPVQPRH